MVTFRSDSKTDPRDCMGLRNRSHGAIRFDRYGGSSHVDRGVGHPSSFWSQRWRLSVQGVLKRIRETVWDSETEGTARYFSTTVVDHCTLTEASGTQALSGSNGGDFPFRVLKRIRETVWDSETEGTARCFPVPCQIIVNVGMFDYSHLSYPLTPSSLPRSLSYLTMASKRLGKKSQSVSTPVSTSGTTADASAKPQPRTAWKTGEQLEYLLSQWQGFVTHQNAGTLDRFWPRVYDTWYNKWSIIPTPESIKQYGSREGAILVSRTENNGRIRTWFHNRARAGSKSTRADLRLGQGDKRKLAPVQAYCTYAWDSGLRETVIARWEEQKLSYMSPDEDDPTTDSTDTPGSAPHIPINFKLKVAREVYNSLTTEQKKELDDRREEERNKVYRTIQDITDVEERDEKLSLHQQNQPLVPKSLLSVLKNLEAQAGCIAHLVIGHVDPKTGKTSCQHFCQGKTEGGLEFDSFCGDDFDGVILKRFKEWGVRIFGDEGSERRSKFMLSKTPSNERGVTSSSVSRSKSSSASRGSKTSPASNSVSASTTAPEKSVTLPPRADVIVVDEDDGSEASGVAHPLRVFEAVQTTPPQPAVLPPLTGQPPDTEFQPPGGDLAFIVPLQTSESPQFVSPQEVFLSPQPFGFVGNYPAIFPPWVSEPPLGTAPPQTVTPGQVVVHPVATEPSLITPSPVLEPSHTVVPHQVVVSPTVTEPLTTHPLVENSQAATPNQAVLSSLVAVPLITPSPVAPHHVVALPAAAVLPSLVTGSPPDATHKPQTTMAPRTSDLTEGVTGCDSGEMKMAKSTYRVREKAGTTAPTRTRRDSFEGAPDIILSLSEPGYQRMPPELPPMFTDNETDISATPSTTPSPDEPLITPAEPGATTIATSGCSVPRAIPNFTIDRSDFPSWLLERERLDFVMDVEAGDIWEKLITTWLKQERRVGFGLKEGFGASLSLKKKPGILKDYFKWHHNPYKGDCVSLPGFGNEIEAWWSSIQPAWRHQNEDPPNGHNDHSYILAGGKKGVFLLILCLAWWDRAHGREVKRLKAARAGGKDETTSDSNNPPNHDPKWFTIVNDLTLVLELAQGSPVPEEGVSHTAAVTPTRRKRAAEQGEISPRKKKKSS